MLNCELKFWFITLLINIMNIYNGIIAIKVYDNLVGH